MKVKSICELNEHKIMKRKRQTERTKKRKKKHKEKLFLIAHLSFEILNQGSHNKHQQMETKKKEEHS